MVTIIMYKLDFNESYYAFLLILLIKVVLCSKIHGTNFMNHMSFSREICRFAKGVTSPDHGRSMTDSAMPKEARVGYLTSVAKASHTSSHSSFEMSKAPKVATFVLKWLQKLQGLPFVSSRLFLRFSLSPSFFLSLSLSLSLFLSLSHKLSSLSLTHT